MELEVNTKKPEAQKYDLIDALELIADNLTLENLKFLAKLSKNPQANARLKEKSEMIEAYVVDGKVKLW